MVIRGGGNVEGDTGPRFQEGGKVNAIQAGRKFAPSMPRKLHLHRKQNTIGIYISKITNNGRQFRRKFATANKILVLCIQLINYTIKVTDLDGSNITL
jgi:hypothetical protein